MFNYKPLKLQQPLLYFDTPALVHFATIHSTHDYLCNNFTQLQQQLNTTTIIVSADHQTNGRGQRNNQWFAANQQALLLSLGWLQPNNYHPQQLAGLPTLVIISLLQTLKQYYQEYQLYLKWPNDLIKNKYKLAGTLVNITTQHNYHQIVASIGLNIKPMPQELQQQFTKYQAAHLSQHHTIDNNQLITHLINKIDLNLSKFNESNLYHLLPIWQKFDYFYKKDIEFFNDKPISGQAQGIDRFGNLMLYDPKQDITAPMATGQIISSI